MSKKTSILLVDDNKSFIELLKDRIEMSEIFEVIGEAYDGERGLELILKLQPEIVILDMIMPILDGLGVLERFNKANVVNYRPKFVVLSAIGLDTITSSALSLGAQYYMIKPTDFDVLIKRLEQIISESGAPLNSDTTFSLAVQRKATEVLQSLGVPPHIKGFLYLKEAIVMVCEDEIHLMRITKSLYPGIATRYHSTPQRVERSIRNAVDLTFERGNSELFNKYFKTVTPIHGGRITNGEFIAYLSNYVLYETEQQHGINAPKERSGNIKKLFPT